MRARYYNPADGRFLSIDIFERVPQSSITLYKYLHANGNPANMVDPSGHFSLGSLSADNAIRGILNSMHRLDKVLNILDVVMGPTGAVTEKLTNKAMEPLSL